MSGEQTQIDARGHVVLVGKSMGVFEVGIAHFQQLRIVVHFPNKGSAGFKVRYRMLFKLRGLVQVAALHFLHCVFLQVFQLVESLLLNYDPTNGETELNGCIVAAGEHQGVKEVDDFEDIAQPESC